jgi:hypothetical protein
VADKEFIIIYFQNKTDEVKNFIRLMNAFLNSVSIDLRCPVNIALGFHTQILKHVPEDMKEIGESSLSSGNHLL